jgi:hypothetical protein
MHTQSTPVHRKRLIDPAACGVRLGVELRAAAEQQAYDSGMCLSHWIKKVVENAISKSTYRRRNSVETTPHRLLPPEPDSKGSDLDSAFAEEMEKLNDK